jgi:biopolymer transport protein ExbD
MSRRSSHKRKELNLPLTPMIDCTFQLIIFFLLTTQLAERELPELDLPSLDELSPSAMSVEEKQANNVTVNVLPESDSRSELGNRMMTYRAGSYQVGVDVVDVARSDAGAVLAGILEARKQQADNRGLDAFWVEIRADRDICYKDVEPVMRAASEAGIEMMSLTATAEDNSGKPEKKDGW